MICVRLSIPVIFGTFVATLLCFTVADSHKDLVQPNETHLEGVPFFIQHPKPIYYTMKDHPAVIECTAEPVSHAAIECAEKIIPYKGPEDSGRLKVTRLDATNRPNPNGDRWHLALQVRPKEVEEWFDSYVCRCEAWNKVFALQRPKKVVSKATVVMEAYLERKFQIEPTSTSLDAGERLELTCVPPEGKPTPEVFWIKNGTRINSRLFPRVNVNEHGHLIIKNTMGSDSGNYTCVAELLGLEYRYAHAQVHIFEKSNKVGLDTSYRGGPVEVLRKEDQVTVPDVVIYTSIFFFLLFLLFTPFAVLFAKRKGSLSHLARLLSENCCAQTKNVYHKQTNGKLVTDPLLLDDYSLGWMGIKTLKTRATNDFPHISSPRSVSLNVIANRHLGSTIPRQAVTVYETLDANRYPSKRVGQRDSHSTCAFSIASANPVFVPLPPPPSSLPPTPASNHSFDQLDCPSLLVDGHRTSKQGRPFFSSNTSQTTYLVGDSCASYNPRKLEMRIPPTVSDFALCLNERLSSSAPAHSTVCQTQPVYVSSNSQALARNVVPKYSPDGKCSTNSTTNTMTISSGNEDSPGGPDRVPFTQLSDPESCIEPGLANIEHSPYDLYAKPDGFVGGLESTFGSAVNKTVYGAINSSGGVLELETSDVILTIPKDALPPSTDWPVELTICREDRARPVLSDCQTLLSPIVQYGPQDLTLLRPALLSFPHCADISRGSWSATLLAAPYFQNIDSKTGPIGSSRNDMQQQNSSDNIQNSFFYEAGGRNQWKPISVVTSDEEDHGLYRLGPSNIQVLTQFPQRYCLIGQEVREHGTSRIHHVSTSQRAAPSEKRYRTHNLLGGLTPYETHYSVPNRKLPHAIKWLCLAAFAGPLTPNMDFIVRVYVLPATKDALTHVKEIESGSGGQLLDVMERFPFSGSGMGLSFRINELSFGWKNRLQVDRQEIPFRHVWSGVQTSLLHCSFSFERVVHVQSHISCKLAVVQGDPASETNVMHLISKYSK